MSQSEAARVFGVSRTSIGRWLKKYHKEGQVGLVSKKSGRKKAKALTVAQAASIRKSVYVLSNRIWQSMFTYACLC
jgi:transposase